MPRLRHILIGSAILMLVGPLAALVGAQVILPPPPPPPPPPPKPFTTAGPRFAPITHAVKTPSGGNGGFFVQQSTDGISCTWDPNGMDNNYTILAYYWSGLDFGNPAPNSASATGYAHNPGVYTPSCSVLIVAKSPGAVPFTAGPYNAKPIYVAGGPLGPGVYGGVQGTPARDGGPTTPFYVEYFGFDPAGATPQGAQNPQNGTVSAYGGQPSTTTYTWSVPGPLEILTTGVGPNTSSLSVGATGGSAGSGIRVKVTYNFNNNNPNDPVSGSCPDDSDKQLDSSGNALPVAAFEFDAHKPTNLKQTSVSAVYGLTTNPWECQRDYNYQLVDDGSANMGYVYIVERWESNWGDTSNFIWYANGPSTTGAITDHFDCGAQTQAYPYNGGSGTPVFGPLNHRYFAATTDTSYYKANGNQTGILVLFVVLNMWTDMITNQ